MEGELRRGYTKQGYAHALNVCNFPEDVGKRPKLMVLSIRYLLQYDKKNNKKWIEKAIELFKYFRQLKDPNMNEVADIINTYSDKKVRRDILRQLREYDEIVTNDENKDYPENNPILYRQDAQIPNKPLKTVYQDSQNVHNNHINKSVLGIAKNLIDKYKVSQDIADDYIQNIREYFTTRFPEKVDLISDSIEYFSTSISTFDSETDNFSLQSVFISVFLFILESDEKYTEELNTRFIEELQEMKSSCTTGHLARLVNVIQGYTEDPDLTLTISQKDQYKSVVVTYLTKKLQECNNENIMSGIVDDTHKDVYISFIRQCVAEKLLEWKRDYKDLNELCSIVNKFCGVKVFSS